MSDINYNMPKSMVLDESIDFSDSNRRPCMLGQNWNVKIEPKKKMRNLFGILKKIGCDVVVKIVNLKVHSMLKLDKDMPLLRLNCAGQSDEVFAKQEHNGFTIHLNDEIKDFSIQFNTLAVTDILEVQTPQAKSYPITFKVQLFDKGESLAHETSVTINVIGAHVMTTPDVSFSSDPNASKTYSQSLGIERVGELKITNPSQLDFAPHLALEVELVVKKGDTPIPANSPVNPFSPDFSFSHAFNIDAKDHKGFSFAIPELGAGSCLTLPINFDYSVVGNPINEPSGKVSYNLSVNVRYCNINEPATVSSLILPVETPIEVSVNKTIPELRTSVVEPGGMAHEFEGLLKINEIQFQSRADFSSKISVVVSNFATEGAEGAGIYIQNFAVKPCAIPNLNLKQRHRHSDGLVSLFKLLDHDERVFLSNNDDSKRAYNFDVEFSGRDVIDLCVISNGKRNYNVKVDLEVTFDYYLDDDGSFFYLGDDFFSADRKQTFKGKIRVPLYQQPNPKWLAIDFGTSAIVAMYGNEMIDLHAVKKQMHIKDSDNDLYEVDTPFLSSNIVLRKVGEEKVEGISQLTRDNHGNVDFDKLALFLSPTSYQEGANSDTVIPCLKLILGYKELPNINNYDSYLYQYNDEDGNLVRNGLILKEEVDGTMYYDPTPLAQIETIFGEVYSELMRYYIRPSIEKGQVHNINRLVLTVPNTYTPRHKKSIEEIVYKHLSDLNIREILFVSESDAVACYYQNNWVGINNKIKRNVSGPIKKNEHVLVYDIGAGTLDVTLLRKHFDTDLGKVVIDVLGKIGISKAGNYLDSLLADLLVKRFEKMEKLANPEEITDASAMVGALKLKTLIKNQLKPSLSSPNNEFTFEQDYDIYIKDDTQLNLNELVINQPEFKQYITDITDDFLDNFFAFFGINDDLKIDTVLMSGRTSKLEPIRRALEKKLQSRGSVDFKIIPVSDLNDKGDEFDKAKTIVAEGAIIFADSYSGDDSRVVFRTPLLNANYGIIYRSGLDGATNYVEILNPREHENVSDYQTLPVSINLGGVKMIKLVQTFSAKTLEDWDNGNREYITVMADVQIEPIRDRENAQVSMIVGKDGYLTLQINGQQLNGLPPSKIDINSPSNARSLWPTKKSAQKND